MDTIKNSFSAFTNMTLTKKIITVVGILFVLYTVYAFLAPKAATYVSHETFADNAPAFRMFYADWCPHCQVAKPEFEKLLELNKKGLNGKPIKVEMIDAEKNHEMAKEFGVEGYPTIILTKNGKNIVYEGPRTESGFMDWLKEHM